MGNVISVNISTAKGTVKEPVPEITVTPTGIEGDAHAGPWHRQISLLARESIDRFAEQAGHTFNCGDLAENITTADLDLSACRILDRLTIGPVELEVTQIGKACHGGGCAIFKAVGKCIMPKEGIFARVFSGGMIRPGDTITAEARPLHVLVLTLSDRASRGDYEDQSGPAVVKALEDHFAQSHWAGRISADILADDASLIEKRVRQALTDGVDLLVTTGGTGIGPRDCTPEAIMPLLDKQIPGVMEHIRMKYGATIPAALLSRSVAGTVGSTLV